MFFSQNYYTKNLYNNVQFFIQGMDFLTTFGIVSSVLTGTQKRVRQMPKKILVVDDDRHVVRLVQISLERAGYEVTTAYDGVEALDRVMSGNPDMIILDIVMPRMDGWEVLRNLQNDPRFQNIPVVILSQLRDDADRFKGWSSGCASYLTKPFAPRELLAHVERIFKARDEPTDEF
jgi:two-component system alkaline phosphatase synthesis response regulator PhoP/two-component system response regulator VicR